VLSRLFLPLSVINYFLVKDKSGYFKETAIDIDRFGNRNFRTLLNRTLQNNGYKFGDERETISSALGKNKRDNTLTKTGKTICIKGIPVTNSWNFCRTQIRFKA